MPRIKLKTSKTEKRFIRKILGEERNVIYDTTERVMLPIVLHEDRQLASTPFCPNRLLSLCRGLLMCPPAIGSRSVG